MSKTNVNFLIEEDDKTALEQIAEYEGYESLSEYMRFLSDEAIKEAIRNGFVTDYRDSTPSLPLYEMDLKTGLFPGFQLHDPSC